jgi:hypothetical protein
MSRLAILLTLACASAVVASNSAKAGTRHHIACGNPSAIMAQGPYVGYNPCNDPNAVFVGGTYAGSDPDPNIRAALRREFGRM